VAGIQAFGGGSTPSNLLGDGANSPVSGFQKHKEPNTQSNTTEQQFSDGATTEERLKSSQSPLDQFLSDTSTRRHLYPRRKMQVSQLSRTTERKMITNRMQR
jgi:hypothetical protein